MDAKTVKNPLRMNILFEIFIWILLTGQQNKNVSISVDNLAVGVFTYMPNDAGHLNEVSIE